MEFIKAFLEQQPMMALFLTIAIGYLVGEVNIKGFSLGVGAVLFVALAMGWFAPKSVPAAMVGTLGLALFLYTVGVQYGKQFFTGLTSHAGRRANLIGLSGVMFAGAVSFLLMKTIGVSVGNALGLLREPAPVRRRFKPQLKPFTTTILRWATRYRIQLA